MTTPTAKPVPALFVLGAVFAPRVNAAGHYLPPGVRVKQQDPHIVLARTHHYGAQSDQVTTVNRRHEVRIVTLPKQPQGLASTGPNLVPAARRTIQMATGQRMKLDREHPISRGGNSIRMLDPKGRPYYYAIAARVRRSEPARRAHAALPLCS
jgi:hypothetical protein